MSDLKRGRNMPLILHGEHLVVWRSESGVVGAWSDRCPHRGMRLSYGAVQNDNLICAYHGWTFGSDGHCQKIPAHPGNVPSRAARARIYPSVEMEGYIWVCLGEPASDRPEKIESLRPVRSLHLPIDTDMAIAALLACPLDPEATENFLFPPDVLKWTRQTATASVEARIDTPSRLNFEASWTYPGRLFCRLSRGGSPALAYQLLFQPASEGRCVIHLSSDGPPVEMNRALVRFRMGAEQLAREPHLRSIYEQFLQATPDQTFGDEVKGAIS
jgi:nitrite reductase/ring-hydroxylating ferredoxin subunit